MMKRLSNLSETNSFFLFGPRGVGKSTLLKAWFQAKDVMEIDLLEPSIEAKYLQKPERLLEEWQIKKSQWIFIDEIQKRPELLDVVHLGIEKYKIKFALTGSSARKLRRGASNLLGGRAFDFRMHPLTHVELGTSFSLIDALRWGTLPKLLEFSEQDKTRFLYGYVSTYLKEEILIEQVIRKVEPFPKFLEVAAQMNGKILNHAKIGRDAGVEEKSVARYFQILDDTLLGFFLPPFHRSLRKRQTQKSKFYFFDTGVTRTLQNVAGLELHPQTTAYGNLFESFVILEIIRLNDYFEKHFQFSYLMTKDRVEVDLIIERPGKTTILVEIKSGDHLDEDDCRSLRVVGKDFKNAELWVISNSEEERLSQGVHYMHWKNAIQKLF